MRVKFLIAVIQAAGLPTVLTAPLYDAGSISEPHGDVRPNPSYVTARDQKTDDERHFHLLIRAGKADNTSVDDSNLDIKYEGDDGIVPVNPEYADASYGDPVTIPGVTEQPGISSQPAAPDDEQTQATPNDKVDNGPETTKDTGTGLAAGGALAGVLGGGTGVAGGALSGGGSAVGGIAAGGGTGGSIPSGDSSTTPEDHLGTDGDKEIPKEASTTVPPDAIGADGAGGSPTFKGDVSGPPPADKPAEIFVDKDGNEGPVPWTSEEGTILWEVNGNGEGALPESGRPGPSRGSGGQPQSSSPIRLEQFRESDRSIAEHNLNTNASNKFKKFDGGRTTEERKLFEDVNDYFTDLQEADAVNFVTGNYDPKQRGPYRYILGKPKNGDTTAYINLGIARHAPNKNSFDQFKLFKEIQKDIRTYRSAPSANLFH